MHGVFVCGVRVMCSVYIWYVWSTVCGCCVYAVCEVSVWCVGVGVVCGLCGVFVCGVYGACVLCVGYMSVWCVCHM